MRCSAPFVLWFLLKQMSRCIKRYRISICTLLIGTIAGFLIALSVMEPISQHINDTLAIYSDSTTSTVGNINRSIFDEIRVLCWVMTNPSNHWQKTQFIKRTWSKRCNIILFMSTADEPVLGTIKIPVEEGREHLWFKVRSAFQYVHKHHLNDADFFMKADDDSYVIVENLRMLVHGYLPSDPIWFGSRFILPTENNQGYVSGGSGYCLSREAIRRLVEIAFLDPDLCQMEDRENEDIEVGMCLQNVNVTAIDGRDSHYKDVFNPFPPAMHLIPSTDPDFWYYTYRFYGNRHEMGDNCSSAAVAFHYVPQHEMLLFDYFIYNVSTYGIDDTYLELPSPLAPKKPRVSIHK